MYEPIDGIEPEDFICYMDTEDGIKRVVPRFFYLKGGKYIYPLYHNNSRLQTDNEINLYGLRTINRTLRILMPPGRLWTFLIMYKYGQCRNFGRRLMAVNQAWRV